ncbi:hypothetical protein [Bacillus smithii]|uniref:hypothetical protein n=1 Tax=Bacillus smithii TaxID=1479 RepID=UPI003D22DD87
MSDYPNGKLTEVEMQMMIMNKKNATQKAAEYKVCCFCNKKAEMENDNGSFICEECADSLSSHAVDMGY